MSYLSEQNTLKRAQRGLWKKEKKSEGRRSSYEGWSGGGGSRLGSGLGLFDICIQVGVGQGVLEYGVSQNRFKVIRVRNVCCMLG